MEVCIFGSLYVQVWRDMFVFSYKLRGKRNDLENSCSCVLIVGKFEKKPISGKHDHVSPKGKSRGIFSGRKQLLLSTYKYFTYLCFFTSRHYGSIDHETNRYENE